MYPQILIFNITLMTPQEKKDTLWKIQVYQYVKCVISYIHVTVNQICSYMYGENMLGFIDIPLV